MNKLFSENGQLTEHGQNVFDQQLGGLEKLLNHATNEAELRIIGCLIASYAGNLVSKRVLDYSAPDSFWKMSDEDFMAYLVKEHESPLFTMSKAECDRYAPIAEKRAKEIKEKCDEVARRMPYLPPGVNFKEK